MRNIKEGKSNTDCVQSSLLEMWRFNEAAIKAVTIEEVIEGVNRLERR